MIASNYEPWKLGIKLILFGILEIYWLGKITQHFYSLMQLVPIKMKILLNVYRNNLIYWLHCFHSFRNSTFSIHKKRSPVLKYHIIKLHTIEQFFKKLHSKSWAEKKSWREKCTFFYVLAINVCRRIRKG